jgi:nucleotide-binding universal stress UspA family protein
MKIKRILLGLGGTDFTPVAVKRGVELARRHGAEITGVTIIDEAQLRNVGPVPAGAAHAARALREHRLRVTQGRIRGAIEDFQERCASDGVPFRVQQETGEAFSLMTNLARYHDLMIFGLRSVFDYGFGVDPQDTLTRLVRSGVRPLIAVSREYREIRRVLLSYGGSAESAKAIKRFVQSQLWPDMQLRLLTCERSAEESETLLDDMAAYCRAHGFEVEREHSSEAPKDRILAAAADWNADLVVLGNGVRNLWLNKILGSTTLHVVQNADRPLYLTQ